VWLRHSGDPADAVVVVFHGTPVPREGYRIGLPGPGRWHCIASSDAPEYGGSGYAMPGVLEAESVAWHDQDWSALVTLPPLAVTMWARTR
jgi:1,4-alpha-glucan branching enzyme